MLLIETLDSLSNSGKLMLIPLASIMGSVVSRIPRIPPLEKHPISFLLLFSPSFFLSFFLSFLAKIISNLGIALRYYKEKERRSFIFETTIINRWRRAMSTTFEKRTIPAKNSEHRCIDTTCVSPSPSPVKGAKNCEPEVPFLAKGSLEGRGRGRFEKRDV